MRPLFFLSLMALLAACSNKDKIPGDIIAKEKMETILWQLMLSDAYVNKELAKDSLRKMSAEKMKIYQQVFTLNGTSISEFKKSYQFYIAHPDITKVMFDSIAVRAGKQRTDLYRPKITLPAKPLKKV